MRPRQKSISSFLDELDSFHSRGSVRISVFWVLSKLVKLHMQSFPLA